MYHKLIIPNVFLTSHYLFSAWANAGKDPTNVKAIAGDWLIFSSLQMRTRGSCYGASERALTVKNILTDGLPQCIKYGVPRKKNNACSYP